MERDEIEARMAAIADGPWMRKAGRARRSLQPSSDIMKRLPADGRVTITKFPLRGKDKSLAMKLRRWLRWHGREPIDESEIPLRASLDEALTYFQLLELAVETGYLPAHQLPSTLREDLLRLLWAPAARQYLQVYGYFAVEYLAQRAGLDGVSRGRVPEPDPRGEVLFSSFLATFRQLEMDKDVVAWLDLLDDYVETVDPDDLYDFLEGDNGDDKRPSRSTAQLIEGAQSFVVPLAQFFRTCPPGRFHGAFGFFYAYWLAKMFGYKVGVRGAYVRDREVWPSGSWMSSMAKYLTRSSTMEAERGNTRRTGTSFVSNQDISAAMLFRESARVLEKTWSITQEFIAQAGAHSVSRSRRILR